MQIGAAESSEPMRTYEIGERDMKIRLHPDYASWLQANVRNLHARNELALAFGAWMKHGTFSINTGRVDFIHGGQATKTLRRAIESSPHIQKVNEAKRGVRSAEYEIKNLDGLSQVKKQPTEIYPSYLPPHSWQPPSWCLAPASIARAVVSREWLRDRAVGWSSWCQSKNQMPTTDYLGCHPMSQHIFDALEQIRFPTTTSWLSSVAPRTGDRWLRQAVWLYHRASAFGEILRRVKYHHGRIYHWLTTCPRALRKLLTIGGERLAEADLGASYFSILAGQMPAGRERNRLIDLLRSGEWYGWLAKFGVVDVGDDPDQIKAEAQKQLLFARDWRVEARPLWSAMVATFPTFGQVIEQARNLNGGPSGFAHHLSRLEGQVMRPALERLHCSDVLAAPLHDGLLVGESAVEFAVQAIRESATRQLGYVPLVRAK